MTEEEKKRIDESMERFKALCNIAALKIGAVTGNGQRLAHSKIYFELEAGCYQTCKQMEYLMDTLTDMIKQNPDDPDNAYLVTAKEALVILQSLSGAYKTYKQEAIDQTKWSDQDGLKPTFTLSKSG